MSLRAGPHEIDGRTVEITSVERILFPDAGWTKGDLVDHYLRHAELVLRYLRGRPITLQRFPEGIGEAGFYQKEAGEHFPAWVETVQVPRRQDDGVVNHVVCRSAADVVYLANQGTMTFHVTPSRAEHLEIPDLVVFDLDPPEDGDVDDVRWATRRVRDAFREIGLSPFIQTTGSKGYHVVAPLEPRSAFAEVRPFVRDLAAWLAREHPDRLTVEQRKAKREGRVFLDTARNAYAQTFVAPYSVRPRPGAPIATPIDWEELGRVDPRTYTLGNISRRLGQKRDPWAELDDERASLDEVRAAFRRMRGS